MPLEGLGSHAESESEQTGAKEGDPDNGHGEKTERDKFVASAGKRSLIAGLRLHMDGQVKTEFIMRHRALQAVTELKV